MCPGRTPTQILESERNRPAEFGSERRAPDGDMMRDAVRSGFDGPAARRAAEVADDVLDGVRNGRFWIITSGRCASWPHHVSARSTVPHRMTDG